MWMLKTKVVFPRMKAMVRMITHQTNYTFIYTRDLYRSINVSVDSQREFRD